MKNLKVSICLLLLINVFAAGCKKDKNNSPDGSSNNKYVYLGNETKITGGRFTIVDVLGTNTLYITLIGEETSNWVQLFFYKNGDTIREGNFTYKDNTAAGYNPANNFAGGNVNLGVANAHEIIGGTVSVLKDGNNYKISVDALTSKGAVKGSYTGTVVKE
jgi:hypothetical protein